MAAAFRPVNSSLSPTLSLTHDNKHGRDEMAIASPTTPRPGLTPLRSSHQLLRSHHQPQPSRQANPPSPNRTADDAVTPTRTSFGSGALASQKPLPTSPFRDSVQVPDMAAAEATRKTPRREDSHHSRKSKDSDDMMDMDESDGEGRDDAGAASDDESVNADGTRSNKKKKSQRFYCTDYPPCTLSFTRSEHLARHIRKHTGERPFQCHCSRRFSRLDNLRQHAQTVHINEDIPIDSLAATGTRFQRQIRTERVRHQGLSAGNRVRAWTGPGSGGIGGGHLGRGHSKSLSTSSITSITSLASVSSMGSGHSYAANESRRRPPPLIMADPRSRLSFGGDGSMSGQTQTQGPGQGLYRPSSPSEFDTPTSATFSTTGQNSPRWNSTLASPTSSHSRPHSVYTAAQMAAGSRTPGRRLSVPSSGNPFSSPHGVGGMRGPMLSLGTPGGTGVPHPSPGQGSLLASPTASNSSSTSAWSRRDSTSLGAGDEAWRRRSWHLESREFPGGALATNSSSRLSQVITPSQFSPTAINVPELVTPKTNANANTIRLPGIESFDPIPPRQPATPPRRLLSPMMTDSDMHEHRRIEPVAGNTGPFTLELAAEQVATAEDRMRASRSFGTQKWDLGLHRSLTRLELGTPPQERVGSWASETGRAVMVTARTEHQQPRQPQQGPTVRFEVAETKSAVPSSLFRGHHHTMSAPSPSLGPKRHGWYHGPQVNQNHTPAPVGVDRIVHPNVSAFQAFPARSSQPPSPPQPAQQAPIVPIMQYSHAQQATQPPQQQAGPDLRYMETRPSPPSSSPLPMAHEHQYHHQAGSNLRRLEALVAVATGEGSAAAAY